MKLRCVFDGCDGGHHARGMCRKHFDAWSRSTDKPPGLGAGLGPAWRILRTDNETLRRRVAELEAR